MKSEPTEEPEVVDSSKDPDYDPTKAEKAEDSDVEIVYVPINQIRGRGRPRLKRRGEEDNRLAKAQRTGKKIKKVFVDEEGHPLTIKDDEVVTPDDAKGDAKITVNGELKGGRKYKVESLKVPHRGDRLYMVSTDVARCVGYRDSYFLFQKHSHLYRVTIDEADKQTLIRNGILSSSFKTRAVYLVTARSVFKQFGARVIVNGKQVTDDYYEDEARKQGAIEGAPAVPFFDVGPTSSHTSHKRRESPGFAGASRGTGDYDTTWIYRNATQCRKFDSMLLYDRQDIAATVAAGKYDHDPYTGVTYVPLTTQPTTYKIRAVKGDKTKLIFDTHVAGTAQTGTGLKDVPREIYEGAVEPDVLAAIEAQKALEM